MSQESVGAICCIAIVVIAAAVAWWLLRASGRVLKKSLHQESESNAASNREVEFLCNADPDALAKAIATGVEYVHFEVAKGEPVRVTSQGALGVVIACIWWEIRVDFSGVGPVRGKMYLRLVTSGGKALLGPGRVILGAEVVNLVMDRVVEIIRQVDPRAQIHGN